MNDQTVDRPAPAVPTSDDRTNCRPVVSCDQERTWIMRNECLNRGEIVSMCRLRLGDHPQPKYRGRVLARRGANGGVHPRTVGPANEPRRVRLDMIRVFVFDRIAVT